VLFIFARIIIQFVKIFIKYLTTFVREHFNPRLYLFFVLFTAALIFLNYRFDIEDGFIDSFYGSHLRMVFFFLLHGFAYYTVLLVSVWITGNWSILNNTTFWVKSLLGFVILSFDRSFYYHRDLSELIFGHEIRFITKLAGNMRSLPALIVPLLIMLFIFDKRGRFGFYGLRVKEVNFKPYFLMLLVIVPLTFTASFLPDFIDFYPVYKRSGGLYFSDYLQWPEWGVKLLFEVFYLLDFISVELFFRGFLVIGLMRFIGKDAVLPMAATYVVLHFGKPLGETVSSAFGGYILGIFAYYSRNIWGGVFVHVGVALTMELFAFMQMGLK